MEDLFIYFTFPQNGILFICEQQLKEYDKLNYRLITHQDYFIKFKMAATDNFKDDSVKNNLSQVNITSYFSLRVTQIYARIF